MKFINISFSPIECKELKCRLKSKRDSVCYADSNFSRKVHCKFLKKYNKLLQEDCCPVNLNTILGCTNYLRCLYKRIDKAKISPEAKISMAGLLKKIKTVQINSIDDFYQVVLDSVSSLKSIRLDSQDRYELARALRDLIFRDAVHS